MSKMTVLLIAGYLTLDIIKIRFVFLGPIHIAFKSPSVPGFNYELSEEPFRKISLFQRQLDSSKLSLGHKACIKKFKEGEFICAYLMFGHL